MNTYHIQLPIDEAVLSQLRAGDRVYLSGHIYTARDAAHKRITEALSGADTLPFDLAGESIYYAGPAPARPGKASGPCGPTTSGRMDAYTPILLQHGLKVMIGKGARNDSVKAAIRENKAVYLGVTGGAAALIGQCIKKSTVIAYNDLGAEAVRCYNIEEMPAVVLYDQYGGDLYEQASREYAL